MGDASRVLPLLLLLESSSMRAAAGEGDGQIGSQVGGGYKQGKGKDKPPYMGVDPVVAAGVVC